MLTLMFGIQFLQHLEKTLYKEVFIVKKEDPRL